uniref:Deoxycytidylate deaminase n=1 Tax=Maylandia zebra TaxID=106582 RepID=A0A3P9BFK2_9CICH
SDCLQSSDLTRTDFLVDTDYFMAVAVLSAQRSKDPNTQVGACLVNQDNKIVGTGHNCMPNDCEGKLPWNREGAKLDTKYIYVCHAELNAIVNASANADVKGCTMYVTLFPCNECTKLIIQAGLKEVVYLCDKYHKTPETKASKKMLDMAGILEYERFDSIKSDKNISVRCAWEENFFYSEKNHKLPSKHRVHNDVMGNSQTNSQILPLTAAAHLHHGKPPPALQVKIEQQDR